MQKDAPSLRSLFIAFFIIFGSGAMFIIVMTAGRTFSFPAQTATLDRSTEIKSIIPKDLPVYDGAVLASAEKTDEGITAKYRVPLGSLDPVREFYLTEMKKLGWKDYANSQKILGFYKDDSGQKVQFKFTYYGGRTEVIASITE